MKNTVYLIASDPGLAGALTSELSPEYPVTRLNEADFSAKPISDAALLIMVAAKDIQEESLRNLLARSAALRIPLVLQASGISAEQRVQLLSAGVAALIPGDTLPAEIGAQIRQLIHCRRLMEKNAELEDQLHRLSQYFSVDVVKMILSNKAQHHDYGENLEATIFFLDIRNFTTISESVEPNLVAALLNRLYTDIMDLILTYHGSVNKIIGDALLATFGCPVRGEHDAANAVECALAIRDTLKLFNETKPAYLEHDIAIGMGIATGRVFAGTIGSYRKMDYTVIGDTVNVASRLEGLTKQTRFDLIIDRATRDLVGSRLKVRKLKVNRVRGRTQPMEIFLVDSLAEESADAGVAEVFFSR